MSFMNILVLFFNYNKKYEVSGSLILNLLFLFTCIYLHLIKLLLICFANNNDDILIIYYLVYFYL